MRAKPALLLSALLVGLTLSATPSVASPEPGSPEYLARDLTNITDAYGRIIGPGGQLQNPAYLPALVAQGTAVGVAQLLTQAANPTRPALTAGNFFPGWNVGNPLRADWDGTRGTIKPVAFTNRYGALLRGDVFAPLKGAKDPYTGKKLTGPFPGVVLTPGSIQGSERMYWWLAQDLAERGYVVLTYDTQGQGTSETFPHLSGADFPFCDPFATPEPDEQTGCPGFTFQQAANFVKGTEDAIDFFFSTPDRTYPNTGAASAEVNSFNPYWKKFDRSNDKNPATSGRKKRFAIIGHSLGAAAVSKVQGTDKRVAAVVALDKLQSGGDGVADVGGVAPRVPGLGIQSEYGFTVSPSSLSGGSSIVPGPGEPEPSRERASGFDGWKKAGVDSMVIVPRASTHLEYTDIPLVLPASRYGQALTSVYTQRWLGRYLKHEGVSAKPRGKDPLLAKSFTYLEPAGNGVWEKVQLSRADQLSFYYCSAYAITHRNGKKTLSNGDIAGVGGCAS